MTGTSFFDILVQFVEGPALCEYIFTDTACAPTITVTHRR